MLKDTIVCRAFIKSMGMHGQHTVGRKSIDASKMLVVLLTAALLALSSAQGTDEGTKGYQGIRGGIWRH